MDEDDIATYTIKTLDDPRTLNKTLYLRPPDNILSQRQLVEMWEKLSGNKLERSSISADDFLGPMKGNSYRIINEKVVFFFMKYKNLLYFLSILSSLIYIMCVRFGLCKPSWNWAFLSHILWRLPHKLWNRGMGRRSFEVISRRSVHAHDGLLETLPIRIGNSPFSSYPYQKQFFGPLKKIAFLYLQQ